MATGSLRTTLFGSAPDVFLTFYRLAAYTRQHMP
jgi:hypothetical protein